MMEGVTLIVTGLDLVEGQDPLGIWQVGSREAAAFAAEGDTGGSTWRLDLPDASRAMRGVLRAQRQDVRQRERQLDAVQARVADFGLASGYTGTVDSRVGALASVDLRRAEAELSRAVMALSSPAVVFEARADVWDHLKQLYAEGEALLAQFRGLVRPVARIETAVAGRSVALTAVDWNGDHQTIWRDGIPPEEMDTHLAAVQLALASRQTLLRLCVVVVTGALEIAIKAHIPGGQILLLPAVYRFVRDVLHELEHAKDGAAAGSADR